MPSRLHPKLLFVVIDGAADSIYDVRTCYELARTPNLDELAKKSIGGLVYPVGPGVAPESDQAVFSLLGYDPGRYHVGRGALEVYGLGHSLIEGREVAFRGNLSYVDVDTRRILSRRCGRAIPTELAKELLKEISYMSLSKYRGYSRTYVGVGYRVAVVIGSEEHELSDEVSNTDPAYERVGRYSLAVKKYEPTLRYSRPLTEDVSARITAELVNLYTDKVIEYLRGHPLNVERAKRGEAPCNAILLRDAGMKPSGIPPFEIMHGFKMGVVADMPVERGIASVVGLPVAEVPPLTGDVERDYKARADEAISTLESVGAAYVHLKGPDEPGHDGDVEGKVRAIEGIDEHFFGYVLNNLDLGEVAILITSDHATPPTVKAHTDDPVPFIIYSPRGKLADGFEKMSEREVLRKGSLGIVERGWSLIPLVKEVVWGWARGT